MQFYAGCYLLIRIVFKELNVMFMFRPPIPIFMILCAVNLVSSVVLRMSFLF